MLHALGIGRAIDVYVRVAQQTLSKMTQVQKIQILFLGQMFVVAELAQLFDDRRGKPSALHTGQAGFRKKLQAVAAGILGKLVKVETVVMLAQLVVVKMFRSSREESLKLLSQKCAIGIGLRMRFHEELQQLPRLGYPV